MLLTTSCTEEVLPTMSYQTLLIDLTDDSLKLNKEDVEHVGELTDDHDGLCLTLSYITDIGNMPSKSVCIDSLTPSFSENVLKRKNQIREFNTERDSLFADIWIQPIHREESHIFASVCRELKVLSQKPNGASKRLIVVSDLFENNTFFKYYGNDHRKLADLPALAEEFREHFDIPENLEGIRLEIKNTPTRENQYDHQAFVELYRHLLEPKGCTVITTQTTTYQIP